MGAALLPGTACTKKESSVLPAGTLDITTTSSGQTFRLGDTIRIAANLQSQSKQHGYQVIIRQSASGDTLYRTDNGTHATQLTVQESWVNTLAGPDSLLLTISSAQNHEGAELSQTSVVKIQH